MPGFCTPKHKLKESIFGKRTRLFGYKIIDAISEPLNINNEIPR